MKGAISQLAEAGWKVERGKLGKQKAENQYVIPLKKTKQEKHLFYSLAVNKTIFSIQDEIDTVFAKYQESSLKPFSRIRNDV